MGTARWLLAGGLVFLLAPSCSSGDDSVAATTTVTAASSEDLATTTSEVTTSTVATAVDGSASIEEAISATVLEGAAAYRDCLAVLQDCQPEEVFAVNSAGVELENLIAAIETLQQQGYEVRVPEDPSLAREYVVAVDLDSSGAEATVEWCQVDASVLYQPGGGPDGEDLVVSEGVGSLLSRSVVRLDDDGMWRSYESVSLQEWEGPDGCPG